MGACVAGGRAIKRVSCTKKLKNACNCFEGCSPCCLAACLPWNFLCILTCETAKFFHLTAQRPPQADSIDSHVNYILTHAHTDTHIHTSTHTLRVRWLGSQAHAHYPNDPTCALNMSSDVLDYASSERESQERDMGRGGKKGKERQREGWGSEAVCRAVKFCVFTKTYF